MPRSEMSIDKILRSGVTPWLFGAATVIVLGAIAYAMFGWIGIAAIGLIGLLISNNEALYGGHALLDRGDLYARQVGEADKSLATPEQKMADRAKQVRRTVTLSLVNIIFVAMSATGLWGFFRYQF